MHMSDENLMRGLQDTDNDQCVAGTTETNGEPWINAVSNSEDDD